MRPDADGARHEHSDPDDGYDFPGELGSAAACLHYTPPRLAHRAAAWLAEAARGDADAAVLDLGAGPATFLVAAARAHPQVRWVGVEAAAELVGAGRARLQAAGLGNARLEAGDLLEADLRIYRGLYLFNPFGQLLDTAPPPWLAATADATSRRARYRSACAQLRAKLEAEPPPGTRLVSSYCLGPELPRRGWLVAWEQDEGRLVAWERVG